MMFASILCVSLLLLGCVTGNQPIANNNELSKDMEDDFLDTTMHSIVIAKNNTEWAIKDLTNTINVEIERVRKFFMNNSEFSPLTTDFKNFVDIEVDDLIKKTPMLIPPGYKSELSEKIEKCHSDFETALYSERNSTLEKLEICLRRFVDDHVEPIEEFLSDISSQSKEDTSILTNDLSNCVRTMSNDSQLLECINDVMARTHEVRSTINDWIESRYNAAYEVYSEHSQPCSPTAHGWPDLLPLLQSEFRECRIEQVESQYGILPISKKSV